MPGFHADELEAQRRAGGGAMRPAIRDFLPEQHRDFFAMLPYLFASVADDGGWPLATVLHGQPGFITSPDPTMLTIAARPDAQDPAAAFFTAGQPIGLLGLDLSTRRRNRANGLIARGDESRISVLVQESFGNCPQYIQRRNVQHRPTTPQPAEALTELDDDARTLITNADTFFVASRARDKIGGGLDISHRGGKPGFVRVDSNTLVIPDFRGNRYYNTLGNLLGEPRASLLFLDFTRGDILQLQGLAEIDWNGDGAVTGAERLWRFRVARGWRRRAALPLCWNFVDYSPVTERTGIWA